MANFVTVSALSMAEPDFSALPTAFAVYEQELKKILQREIDRALTNEPDLIVFPECASRFAPKNGRRDRKEDMEYYRFLGNKIEEFLAPIARDSHVNIAYSAIRLCDPASEHPFRNSTTYIDRDGVIAGIYDKNHLMIMEYEECGVAYGTQADLIPLDFGNVASAICFDLNFDDLLQKYVPQKPDMTVFCSMYHGGLRQAQWALATQSYFVGAICGTQSTILDPLGNLVAASSNYTDGISATVNLDCRVCHLDYNTEKLAAAKAKYKNAIRIDTPSHLGRVLLTVNDASMTAEDVLREFDIQTADEYFAKNLEHRKKHIQLI